jgi:hypothetical protein
LGDGLGKRRQGRLELHRIKTAAGIFTSLAKALQERNRRIPGDWAACSNSCWSRLDGLVSGRSTVMTFRWSALA